MKFIHKLLIGMTLSLPSPALRAADADLSLSTLTYARQLVTVLAGRPLLASERKQIADNGQAALEPLITTWLESGFFPKSFRIRVEMMLSTSGSRDGVDFNLPGNLAEYIAKQKLPFETLLTADYCVNGNGAKVKCDSGSPFDAGVLSTRGFLLGHAGRFNLGRANSMMSSFACTHYPIASTVQPSTPKAELISNFQVTSEAEGEKLNAGGFGNGLACYTCHGQFSAHTQLFVKFDDKGLYKAEATGAQSKTLEFGKSDNGLYASHFADATRMADQKGNMLGKEVENLAEAGHVLAASEEFKECMIGKVIVHALNLDSEAGSKVSSKALKEIADAMPENAATSVQRFYQAVLLNPIVQNAFAKGLGDAP